MGDEQIVQPAGPGEPDLVGGIEHARGFAQQRARAVEGERLQKRLRGEPGPAPEQMMQFGRRDAGGFRDLVDLGLRAPVAADMRDGATDDVVVGGGVGERARSVMRSGESMEASIICSPSRRRRPPCPPDFCARKT